MLLILAWRVFKGALADVSVAGVVSYHWPAPCEPATAEVSVLLPPIRLLQTSLESVLMSTVDEVEAVAAPEDVTLALWDGVQNHQLTLEWRDGEWRCAAGEPWAGALGSTATAVEDKNIIASWQKDGRPALEHAMLRYNPTSAAAAAAAAPSSQLSLTPPQVMLALLQCGQRQVKQRVALATSFTQPMARLLRQMEQPTDTEWAEQLTTKRRSDVLVDMLRRKAQAAAILTLSPSLTLTLALPSTNPHPLPYPLALTLTLSLALALSPALTL